MDTPNPVDLGRIAQDLQIRRVQVENVAQLLDEGYSVPYITRYCKERTGGMPEGLIREVRVRLKRARDLSERKQTILKTLEVEGHLTEDLASALREADSPRRLDDLYLPYRQKKKSRAADARELGLEALALRVWNRDETLEDLQGAAAEFLNAEKGIDDPEKVLAGVREILAESIGELAMIRDPVRRLTWRTGKIKTSKNESVPEGKGAEYRDFFNFAESVLHIPPHRMLAINRGEKDGVLSVKLDLPRAELEHEVTHRLPLDGHPHRDFFASSASAALDLHLIPAMEREVKRELTEVAERHAIEVFARNLRRLLLQPPVEKQAVLAINPDRKSSRLVVLDPQGNLVEQATIHMSPAMRRYEAKQLIKDLVAKHQLKLVAVGNGPGLREAEELVSEIINEGTHFHRNPGVPFPTPVRTPAKSDSKAQARDASGAATDHGEPQTTSGGLEAEAAQEAGDFTAEPGTSLTTEHPASQDGPVQVDTDSESSSDHGASDANAATPNETPPSNTNGEVSHSGENADPDPTLPPISGGSSDEAFVSDESQAQGGEAQGPVDHVMDSAADLSASGDGLMVDSTVAAGDEVSPNAANTEEVVASPSGLEFAASSDGAQAFESGSTDESQGEPPAVDVESNSKSTAESKTQDHAAGRAAVAPGMTPLTAPPKGAAVKPQAPIERPLRPKTPPPPPSPHDADVLLSELHYVVVNAAGVQVYASSSLGREELPELDPEVRAAISVGRRLQDPLAELVKVEPHNLGIGQYQRDVSTKALKPALEHVVESCVNFVGVDLNTASATLLARVSGLNSIIARRILEHRAANGPFRTLEALKPVDGITDSVFEQAVGFLRVVGGDQPLDDTAFHANSYPLVEKLLSALETDPASLASTEAMAAVRERMDRLDVAGKAKEFEISEPALRDLLTCLHFHGSDIRDDMPKPILKRGLLKLDDLAPGTELKGTVLNVVEFGAFVDVGLKDSGLVHISQLANRYVKDPHEVVSVGDIVSVWVMGVDKDRKRVSLTMIDPKDERSRDEGDRGPRQGGPRAGGPGGGGRRGGGPNRGPGGDRGGGGRNRERPPGSPAPPAQSEPPKQQTQNRDRIPGPPQRAQQGRGGRFGPGGRGGGGGRGPGGGRPGRPQGSAAEAPGGEAQTPPKPKPKPDLARPQLSDEERTGNSPLRTFGQLKQLFELRAQPSDEPDAAPATGDAVPHSEASAPANHAGEASDSNPHE